MASKKNRNGSSALDSMLSGFAAGAAAFIVYAMPQASFENAVALTGLANVLPAAQPPLGMTARSAVMLAAGVGSFALVWFILRALGKPSPKKKRRAAAEELEMAPPRLRRADMHPDAPSRRPILAGVDLGRSFDDLPSGGREKPDEQLAGSGAEIPTLEQETTGYSSYIDDDTADLPEISEEQPVEHAAGLPEWIEQADEFEEAEPQAWPLSFQPVSRDEPAEFDPVAAEGDEPQYQPFEEEAYEGPQVDEVEPAEASEEDEPLDLSPRELQTVDALAHRLPQPRPAEGSISDLVERLEAGLKRRQPSRWSGPVAEAPVANGHSADGDPVDARLRGAIQELQKLASRG